ASPRLVDRNNDYLFSNGTDPGSLTQNQTLTQAFGKVTYSSNRYIVNGSILATPQRSTGTIGVYNGTGTNFRTQSKTASNPLLAQGFSVDQYNATGEVSVFLSSSSLLSVKSGLFYDNYKDTGISQVTSYTYQLPAFDPSIPGNLQGPTGTTNTPRTQ